MIPRRVRGFFVTWTRVWGHVPRPELGRALVVDDDGVAPTRLRSRLPLVSLKVGVQGGTGAGVRPPFEGHRIPWLCPNCRKVTNPGYRGQCSLCGQRRPG